VATVLVDPLALRDLELALMVRDLRLWPVRTAPICADGPRTEFQLRRRLLLRHRGEWELAADWTPAWIGFGPTWQRGDEPLPWVAHKALWGVLESFATSVRFHRRLEGVRRLPVPEGVTP
jgi:hypothetical protein